MLWDLRVMCCDNETIKWNHNGKDYCVHIQKDNSIDIDPRNYDHDSVMACFGKYSNYGDHKEETTAEDFWRNLVWQICNDEEIFNALIEMELYDTCVICDDVNKNKYCLCQIQMSDYGNKESSLPIETGLNKNEVVSYAKDELSIADCMALMNNGHHAMWLPLYVHEHSGVSMNTKAFNDKWDASCVGWIVIPMCQTHTSTDEMRVTRLMQQEVEEYNDWLQGNVYRYTLYHRNGDNGDEFDDWIEIDDCGGFIGYDIIENGMTYNVGNGLEEAIKNGNYEIGEAKKTVVVKWEF